MKKETYLNWTIVTDRVFETCGEETKYTDIVKLNLSKSDFKFGVNNCIRIESEYDSENKLHYYIEGHLFNNDIKIYLRTKVNDDNYHALIDEANDVIRALLTQMHNEIISCINILPEI